MMLRRLIIFFAMGLFQASGGNSVSQTNLKAKTPISRWCSAEVRTGLKEQVKAGNSEAACKLYWHYITYMDFFLAADWAHVALSLGAEDDALRTHVRFCKKGGLVAFVQEGKRTIYLPKHEAMKAGWLKTDGEPAHEFASNVLFYKFVGVDVFLAVAYQQKEVDGPDELHYFEELLEAERKYRNPTVNSSCKCNSAKIYINGLNSPRKRIK